MAVTIASPGRVQSGNAARQVVYRTQGRGHGPITRLMSPGDLGELLKPFVFLDLFDVEPADGPGFPAHPHSGIATLTTLLAGGMTYADSTGKSGVLKAGAVEWMRAGGGIWHMGAPVPGGPMRGYQLWLALPAALELSPPESFYIDPGEVPRVGPARVVLGSYQGVSSPIPLPVAVTYLHVRLSDGEGWVFQPEAGHEVAFLAVNAGRLLAGGVTLAREIAVFAEGGAAIEVVAEGEAEFVIGAAVKHPHELVTGYYSVHTRAAALAQGERQIAALARTPQVAALRG